MKNLGYISRMLKALLYKIAGRRPRRIKPEFRLAPGFTRTDMSRYLETYSEVARRPLGAAHAGKPDGERCVWQLWLQGEDSAPPAVRMCIDSVRRHTRPLRHVLLDGRNYREYANVPAEIVALHDSGEMGHAAFSDYIRLALLAKHGGVWIDATVWLSGPVPDEMLNSEFFVFSSPLWGGPDFERLTAKMLGLLRFFSTKPSASMFGSSWWICAAPSSPVVAVSKALADFHWSREDRRADYLWVYDLMSLAILENPECREEWRRMPRFSTVPTQLLRSVLEERFDDGIFRDVLSLSPVHKLKRNIAFGGGQTFADRILGGWRGEGGRA